MRLSVRCLKHKLLIDFNKRTRNTMKTPIGSTNSFEKVFLAPKIKGQSWLIFNDRVQTKKPFKRKSPINLSDSSG